MQQSLLSAFVCLNLLVSVSASRSALAQSTTGEELPTAHAVPAEPRSTPAREWYGMPIVVTDLAALGSLLLASQLADSTSESTFEVATWFAGAGLGVYALGGPFVHFTEGRTEAGFGSLGLRVGAPLVGGALGAVVGGTVGGSGGCEGEWCGFQPIARGAVIGFGIGVITALVVDYAALAYKPAESQKLALSITPTYRPITGEAGVAVSGRW